MTTGLKRTLASILMVDIGSASFQGKTPPWDRFIDSYIMLAKLRHSLRDDRSIFALFRNHRPIFMISRCSFLCLWVQRFTVVDNSDFPPTGLTAQETLLLLASQEALPASHFQQRGF
jgi:hypothetical protein